MTTFNIILCIFTTTVAASYGWGMRGTTIGGEKGAMLPGALIGTFLALFSGVPIVRENFFIFAALGAIGMYFGGSMTYGETLSFSHESYPAENMKKGLIALFVKGALWFGVFGGIFAVGTDIVCGKYVLNEVILLLVLVPLTSIIFYLILNKPLNSSKKVFPKIYFSKTRQESWGALFGMFVVLLGVSAVKKSEFALVFIGFTTAFGAVGWVVGQALQVYFKFHAVNSKNFIIRKMGELNVDTWKIMECTLGAFGGLGSSLAFVIARSSFANTTFFIEKNTGIQQFLPRAYTILTIIWMVFLAADMVQFFVKKPLLISTLKKQYKDKKITKPELGKLLEKAVPEVPKRYIRYEKLTELCEPILYAAFPFIMIAFGDIEITKTVSFFIVFWVIVQEISFEKFNQPKLSAASKIISGIIGLIIVISQFAFGLQFSLASTILMYGVFYELFTIFWILNPLEETDGKKGIEKVKSTLKNKSLIITHSYFIITIIIFTVITFLCA